MIRLPAARLAAMHGLPESAVMEEIERAVSSVLSARLGLDVEAWLNGEGMEFFAFPETKDGIVAAVRIERTGAGLARAAARAAERRLAALAASGRREPYRRYAGTLVRGEIIKTFADGGLAVAIEGMEGDIHGVCPARRLPPRERGKLHAGSKAWFHAMAVRTRGGGGEPPRLEMVLARTTKRIVELLFGKETGMKVECVRRIAGGISFVESQKPLPREAIRRVCEELGGERIKVKWR
ncbi:MAG: hypothetical protein ACNS63_04510 [Candidatus Nitrospinota bacterium M3_3B_026]